MSQRIQILSLIFVAAELVLVILAASPVQARDPYFPPNAFDVTVHPYNTVTRKFDGPAKIMSGAFSDNWYSKQLAAMGEEPLYNRPAPGTVYRLTWLRSFDKPMTFRWTILPSGDSTLLVKRASRQVMFSGQVGELVAVCRNKGSSECEYAEPSPVEHTLHRMKGNLRVYLSNLLSI